MAYLWSDVKKLVGERADAILVMNTRTRMDLLASFYPDLRKNQELEECPVELRGIRIRINDTLGNNQVEVESIPPVAEPS